MIAPDTAALALSVVQGLIKFGGRLDRLMAENVALRTPLAFALPPVNFGPPPELVLPKLQAYLAATTPAAPGPLGVARAELAALLPAGYVYSPDDLAALRKYYALAYPEEAVAAAVSPDGAFLQYLRATLPSLRGALPANATPAAGVKPDAERTNLEAAALVSAFYVDPGQDARQLGYPVRVGLLVLDVLAEFGAENTQLFVRDAKVRAAVQAVLERFAKPDLESYDAWSPLLRHALNATLNGVLDARAAWQGDNPWLGATLGALADAREAAGAQGDNYLAGLLAGEGYPLLISKGLTRAAGVLDATDAPAFQQVAADVLKAAAPLVAADEGNFGAFFSAHWPELLHAGLESVAQHGPALLADESPVVRDVLLAAVDVLAQPQNAAKAALLSPETLFATTNAAIGAVATHPEIWDGGGGPAWLGQVISAALGAVSARGVQATFTPAGRMAILNAATAKVAEHPEWLVKHPGLLQAVVGGVLQQLSGVKTLAATTIADAAVGGALAAIATRPELLGTRYADVIASFAGLVGKQVASGGLTALQAKDLVEAAAGAVLLHPGLFADATTGLAGVVTKAVLQAAAGDPAKLVAGTTLVALVEQLFAALARNGAAVVAPDAIATLEDRLATVLTQGLAVAQAQLGQGLDLPALPGALAELVREWARGGVGTIDAKDPAFQALFAQLAAKATAGAG